MEDVEKAQEIEYLMQMIMHVHLPTDIPVAGPLLSFWKSAN